jgi:hypothetical protein
LAESGGTSGGSKRTPVLDHYRARCCLCHDYEDVNSRQHTQSYFQDACKQPSTVSIQCRNPTIHRTDSKDYLIARDGQTAIVGLAGIALFSLDSYIIIWVSVSQQPRGQVPRLIGSLVASYLSETQYYSLSSCRHSRVSDPNFGAG